MLKYASIPLGWCSKCLLEDQLANRHSLVEFDAKRAMIAYFKLDLTIEAGVNCWSCYMDCKTKSGQRAFSLYSRSNARMRGQTNLFDGPSKNELPGLEHEAGRRDVFFFGVFLLHIVILIIFIAGAENLVLNATDTLRHPSSNLLVQSQINTC